MCIKAGLKEDKYCLFYRIILRDLDFFGERSEGDSIWFSSLLMEEGMNLILFDKP